MEGIQLGYYSMMQDFNECYKFGPAHATTFDPSATPEDVIADAYEYAVSEWNSGTLQGKGSAIHTLRDIPSHKGSFFPEDASFSDYGKHIIQYDLVPDGSHDDVASMLRGVKGNY